jgi:hypothetical protein
VRVRILPYHLQADRIHLSLGKWGVRVKGSGLLTFCPCDTPPIAIGFSGGWAGPPDELIVEDPTLRIFGLPVFWLPYMWLRSPRKLGLTTPEVAVRGGDGLFLGQGVHVPIESGLELSVGAYSAGGFASALDLASERTSTLVRLDLRRGEAVEERGVPSGVGLSVDARGDLLGEIGPGRVATGLVWDVDAIRDRRGIRTTTELEPLSRPWDHGSARARIGPTLFGLDLVDARFGPVDRIAYVRPWSGLAASASVADLGGVDAQVAVGPRFVAGRGAETLVDASLGAMLGAPVGIASLAATTRVDGRLARDGGDDPAIAASGSRQGAIAAEASLEASLPLARSIAFERAAGGTPILHVVEPLVRATAVGTGASGVPASAATPARASGGRAALEGFVANPALGDDARGILLLASGVRTSLGAIAGGIAPGRDPFLGKLVGSMIAGLLLDGGRDRPPRSVATATSLQWSDRRADGGSTRIAVEGALLRAIDRADPWAWLVIARSRYQSSRDGLGLDLRGALRGDLPVAAGWALLGAELAPRLGPTALEGAGASVGAGLGFPIGFGVRLASDVDLYAPSLRDFADRSEVRLLQVHSTLRYRHPCGCFRAAIRGGRTIGREGIDLFATFELAQVDPNAPPL